MIGTSRVDSSVLPLAGKGRTDDYSFYSILVYNYQLAL
jgi:hypothetical protein